MGARGKPKTGGRKSGTPNKSTQRALQIFDKYPDFDPLEAMILEYQNQIAEIAQMFADLGEPDSEGYVNKIKRIQQSQRDRTTLLREITQYKHSKLSTTTIQGDPEKPLQTKIIIGLTDE